MCWSSQGTLSVPHCCPRLLAQCSKALAEEEGAVLISRKALWQLDGSWWVQVLALL